MEGHFQINASIKYSAFNLSTHNGVGTSSYVWALSVVPMGQIVAVATQFRDTLLRHSGHNFDDIVSTVIQDRCAKVNN